MVIESLKADNVYWKTTCRIWCYEIIKIYFVLYNFWWIILFTMHIHKKIKANCTRSKVESMGLDGEHFSFECFVSTFSHFMNFSFHSYQTSFWHVVLLWHHLLALKFEICVRVRSEFLSTVEIVKDSHIVYYRSLLPNCELFENVSQLNVNSI